MSRSPDSAKRKLTAVSQKEKEDLDDVSSELELADEDDKIPYTLPSLSFSSSAGETADIFQLQNRRFLHLLTSARSPRNAGYIDE